VSLNKNKFDVVALREQGLVVTVCRVLNETWYIKDDSPVTSQAATNCSKLKSANQIAHSRYQITRLA
jgi:hypothetical protein